MQPISLFELNSLIKHTLSTQLAPSYWVIAEISELRTAQKGHCYLELVEKEGNALQAKLRATIWSYAYRNISGWFETLTGQSLKPGMSILANISIDFHELYGLSANIKDIDPRFTLGERARKRQEIIERLTSEGVFEMNKMLTLPLAPQRIAVISSSTAAGYGDFMEHLLKNDRNYHFHVDLYNSMMQGCDAPASIIKALLSIHQRMDDYDLVVLVRGGGAQVDMDCFDDYDLASHVAQFPLPVITGIGHERDESITDLVAHTKMKTPTAVSAFLISGMSNFENNLDSLIKMMESNARRFCQEQNFRLADYLKFFSYQKTRIWDKQNIYLSQLQQRIKVHSGRSLKSEADRLGKLAKRLKSLTKETLYKQTLKVDYIDHTLKLSDPDEILKKGYTISYIENKTLNKSNPAEGATMVTKSSNLIIESKIKKLSRS